MMAMKNNIERLPEEVRNSVRSGVILFDFTRVVQELVFNSLDARATKVSIFIGVGRSYVKVVDDGSGVTRDGLVLLGERYATSKLRHFDDMDAAGTFGFRGEALSSLSDISLLEVCSKAYGCPNGYRKVMKGRKCLYLGIDNDRKDVGTTVLARDLFYNQPVRRKRMHSSPKKVLYDAKKSVLQIALVHSGVCFKVVDIESEEELLCTNPSLSPLTLLMSASGIGDSSCFRELDARNGELKLSGYLSDPFNGVAAKAFQYVYINSRFISKGLIHKLLNELAQIFESLESQKACNESHKRKRSRLQACTSYILNITCPRSLYDLSFEPSKTVAEFKDWSPILKFVEHTIQRFWRENRAHEESFSDATELLEKDDVWHKDHEIAAEEDWPENPKFVKKCRIQKHQSPSHCPSFPMEMLSKEPNHPDIWQKKVHESQELHGYFAEFDEQEIKMAAVSQTDHSYNSLEDTLLVIHDSDSIPNEVCSLDNRFTAGFTDMIAENIDSVWKDEPSKVEFYVDDGPMGNVLSCESHRFVNDWQDTYNENKSYLQKCSSERRTQRNTLSFARDEDFNFLSESSKFKLTWESTNEMVDCFGVGLDSPRSDSFSRSPWHNEVSNDQHFTGLVRFCELSSNHDPPSVALAEPFPFHAAISEVEDVPYGSFSGNRVFDSSHKSRNSKWCFETSELFQPTDWDVEHFTSKSKLEYNFAGDEKVTCGGFAEHEDQGSRLEVLSPNNSSLEKFTSIRTTMDIDCFDSYKGFHTSFQQNDLGNILSQDNSCMLSEEGGRLYWDSSGNDYSRIHRYNFQSKHSFRRSRSAPPVYRKKRKFLSLNCNLITKKELDTRISHDSFFSEEDNDSEHALQSSDNVSRTTLNIPAVTENLRGFGNRLREFPLFPKQMGGNQDSQSFWTKWRHTCTQMTENKSDCTNDPNKILDISSGYLHLAADSLVPRSIGKETLQNAKVLQQVDKKFIPIVANGTLALIDQHAADERIRLEELRGKVLSGEGKTVTYLDAEHELILPEIGYQLLQNYAEQIKDWGWICSIDDQGSRSFKKNLTMLQRHPAVVKLLAVPCILGVNLSDIDLLEFLQQLADTDGSSTIPPSVIRVLNLKACRGAIMFGDSLLPSECSLIVEELKQTSLCFQCAHGRPTTVPLVDLEALHKHVAKMESNDERSDDLRHGLHRHGISLERAFQRLGRAKC